MKFITNPENYEQNYLENLNNCFPNWGNIETYNWVINRKFNNIKPDFFVIENDENQTLAGSAISYRKLKFQDNSYHEIGIMTGSWTLPISRGMGCFTETIKKSSELVALKRMPFLTAFVTKSNASFRRLQDACSYLLATNYIISEHLQNNNFRKNNEVEILENNLENKKLIFNIRKQLLANTIHFDYDFNDFESQFIKRLNPVFLLNINKEYAIIEETQKMFQLHFSSTYSLADMEKIVNWANSFGKELIFFTTNIENEFVDNKNYKIVDGYFTILKNETSEKLDYNVVFDNKFNIEYGDKM
ncbi:MAG: hypothetical protein H7174_01365 [Flavobacterium sp.]|nr:hypothetical protein [Flavobacterium sp.]